MQKELTWSDVVVFPIYVPELPEYDSSVASRPGDRASTYGFSPWSCVSYVKARRPDQTAPWGYPNKVEVYDILFPFKGLIVITTEGKVGHAAYVEEVLVDTLRVSECNYKAGLCTERLIKIGDPIIRGYR